MLNPAMPMNFPAGPPRSVIAAAEEERMLSGERCQCRATSRAISSLDSRSGPPMCSSRCDVANFCPDASAGMHILYFSGTGIFQPCKLRAHIILSIPHARPLMAGLVTNAAGRRLNTYSLPAVPIHLASSKRLANSYHTTLSFCNVWLSMNSNQCWQAQDGGGYFFAMHSHVQNSPIIKDNHEST